MSKKNNIKKTIMTTALASTVIFTSISPAVASGFELYNITQNKGYENKQLQDIKVRRNIEKEIRNNDKFAKEINNKLVNYEDYTGKLEAKYIELFNKGLNQDEILKELAEERNAIVEDLEEVDTELKVKSVSAIKDMTIGKEETELKFLVNGTEKLTAKEFEAKYEGYTVEFKYNKAEMNEKGKVIATENFKYAVQVKDADGKFIPEEVVAKDFVDVKVIDMAAIKEVTEIGLTNKLATVAMRELGVKVIPTKAINNAGKVVEAKDIKGVTIDTVVSSDTDVLQVTRELELVAREAGKATLTVNFKDLKEALTLEVEVTGEQELGSITNETTLAATTDTKQVKFDVLDKSGNKYRNTTENVSVKVGAESAVNKNIAELAEGTKIGTLAAGKHKVVVKTAVDGDLLGEYTLELVDPTAEDIAKYDIKVGEDDKEVVLDVNENNKEELEQSFKFKVETRTAKDVLKNSNLDIYTDSYVVKVLNEAGKAVKAEEVKVKVEEKTVTLGEKATAQTYTLVLSTKEAAFVEEVARMDFTVKNSTEQVTKIELAEGKTAVEITDENVNNKEKIARAIEAAIKTNLDSNTDLVDAGSIFLTANDTVEFKIVATHGGMKKELPLVIEDTTAPEVKAATVNGKDIDIKDIKVSLDKNEINKDLKATVTLSEDAKATVTVDEETISVDLVEGVNELVLGDYTSLLEKLNAGKHTKTVRLTDNAGNFKDYTVELTVTEEVAQ